MIIFLFIILYCPSYTQQNRVMIMHYTLFSQVLRPSHRRWEGADGNLCQRLWPPAATEGANDRRGRDILHVSRPMVRAVCAPGRHGGGDLLPGGVWASAQQDSPNLPEILH